jgi:hypothetical protein
MVRGSRDQVDGFAGRLLPFIVFLAALVVVGGLLSVRADGPIEGFLQGAPLVQ